jgi:hypothetical protein
MEEASISDVCGAIDLDIGKVHRVCARSQGFGADVTRALDLDAHPPVAAMADKASIAIVTRVTVQTRDVPSDGRDNIAVMDPSQWRSVVVERRTQ